jgi:hypothetical protein
MLPVTLCLLFDFGTEFLGRIYENRDTKKVATWVRKVGGQQWY